MPQLLPRPRAPILAFQERLLAHALSCAANAIFITDSAGQIIWTNQAFGELSGYAPHEALGQTPALLKSGVQGEAFYLELWQTILAGRAWRGSVVDRRKDGSLYTVDQTITPLLDEHGAITHFMAVQQDMTLQKQEQEHTRFLAYHDALTGLPNRALLLEMQRQAIAQADASRRATALLFLDLDGFKPVNDTFGHDVGDLLLLAVAQRLTASVRRSDVVARIGGDEFVILLPDLAQLEIAVALARKLVDAIARPFMIAEHEIRLSASIGIAIHPTHGERPDELMRLADQAMYAAKKRGGNGYQLHDAPAGLH